MIGSTVARFVPTVEAVNAVLESVYTDSSESTLQRVTQLEISILGNFLSPVVFKIPDIYIQKDDATAHTARDIMAILR